MELGKKITLVFLSNFFNDHQKAVADAFYKKLGDNYHFIETTEFNKERLRLGFKKYSEPYTIQYNKENKEVVQQLIDDADVVIFGQAPISLIKKRIISGKLTFRNDESRYKSLIKYLKWPIYSLDSLYFNKGYLLCSSAFGCRDYNISGMKVEKCFKWGYFPMLKVYDEIDKLIEKKESDTVSILWAGRLIRWKHPELAIELAKKLREKEIPFNMNVIGAGALEKKLRKMIARNNISDCVHLWGPMPPDEVREHMVKSQIFIFTSDRGEGWGAVLNEAMNSACAVVASSKIGSVPYLVDEDVNGMIFKDKNTDNLFEKVFWLIQHPDRRKEISKEAYATVSGKWSAESAVNNYLSLVDSILSHKKSSIFDGPCSHAERLSRNWHKG